MRDGSETRRFPNGRRRRTPAASRGFALVIVLGMLLLLSIVAVTFLATVRTERTASTGYRASVSARQLADTAVSLAQGQITMATTQGSEVAWASQPGMIRTFNNTTGALINAYKLYSAGNLIGDSVNLSEDLPPQTWSEMAALWTDLNAPVEVDGIKNFPILDPSPLSLPAANRPEGFSITGAPATTYQPAPMPVRWLYMLLDGQLVAPSNTSGNTAVIPGATKANPIVGRIAFWTDDDTCKLNINTASEGSYWDTPRVLTAVSSPGPNLAASSPGESFDLGYAEFLPAQREYQRYAGHPASTSLSAVFPFLTRDQIYGLVPRITAGGSNAGTTWASAPIAPDSDRLLTNLEEAVFLPDRSVNGANLTKQQFEQAKFFLTAHSRAPETNLFNLPRVAMWPIYTLGPNGAPDVSHTTPFDRLIAFCSSTGKIGTPSFHPYLFQRQDADSATVDIGIARNGQLLNYLSYLTDQSAPGFGGKFSSKYPDDRDQILTETFDYIRSMNLQDEGLEAAARYTDAPGTSEINSAAKGYGWVVPSRRGTGAGETMGFGRAYTISKMTLVFIANAVADDPATTDVDESHGSNMAAGPQANTALGGTALPPGKKSIQAMIFPDFFSPMQGLIAMQADMQITISGLETLRVNGQALFPPITESAVYGANGGIDISRIGGYPHYRYFGLEKQAPARGSVPGDAGATAANLYPFIGTPIIIDAPATGGTMAFTGGEITVSVYAGTEASPAADRLIQKFTINFPDGTFPVPELATYGVNSNNSLIGAGTVVPENTGRNWWGFSRFGPIADGSAPGRLAFIHAPVHLYGSNTSTPAMNYGPGAFVRPELDTVQQMVAAPHGDHRLVAGNPEVNTFVPHRYYGTRRMAATLMGENKSIATVPPILPDNDFGGKYVSSITYDNQTRPDIPGNATQTPGSLSTGDFDNGIADSVDGPYINKSDEGDALAPGQTTGGGGHYAGWPYFRVLANNSNWKSAGTTFFSPNRQVPSPGVLGSLPTGVKSGVPWKTLLFRPQTNHPSHSATIPDHLFMDLFWMPVVEPYAISDRFSTAGKVNLNYQILPFTYIERSTGLRAVLKSERQGAIPNWWSRASLYSGAANSRRLALNRDETLKQLRRKFTNGEIFKSASEICDIHMIPTGTTLNADGSNAASVMNSYWTSNAQTGDNLRERIYATLYPRLTTKSNTFTVHFRVQTLKQVPSSTVGTWTEGRDVVLAEYRGATTIERFIDANNPDIPDYAATPSSIPAMDPLDTFYRWRVIENRRFAP